MTDDYTTLRDSAFMQVFLDLVVPPSVDGKMPGAGSLGLATELADVLAADDRFGPSVEAGLRAVQTAALEREPGGFLGLSPEARLEVIESQLVAHPALMPGVTSHLYLAYYQHPTVLAGLGEPARPPFPEGFEVQETDPRLLEKLRARGNP